MVTATTAPDDSTELTIGYTYDLNGLRTGKTVTTRTYSTHTHNYTNTVVAPTCTTDGYTLHECACGDSYQDSTVSKLGHAYQQVSQSGGTITYRCTRCGHIYYSSEIIIPPQPPTDPPVIASLGDDENAEAAPLTETETGETDSLGEAGDEPSATAIGSGDGRSLISTVTEHHDYIYASGLLLRETITTTAADGTVTVETLDFAYDNTGTPYALTYTDGTTSTTYYYITNLQGDVMYLVEANGDTAAEYAYDAYGNITAASGSMAEINPLRYRGYYYDKESGFYYLQSRYYDPAVCRFVNADGYASTGQGFTGYNMFAYCLNNPIGLKDSGGSRAVESNTVVVFDGSYLEGYMSAEQAAMVFGQKYSYHTVISGKEIAANIFVRDVGGQQRYFIGDIYFGGPSSVTIISYINNPEWAAYVHTHPMGSCEFSKKDLERIGNGRTGRADFKGFILTGDETLWKYDMEQKQSVPVGHYNMVPYKIRGGSDAARISKVNMLY